ncbi:TetR/AcrR family transcriptional regulator [Bacillus cereus]|uniref:TetR/AcrR family transcriptional regulator n=2 Tax=Bacillus cereus group TaxID=86661 RepID=A0A2C2FJV6_BACCE|nr:MULTISPECIES: TetR/AcrR family transcriptional regulator [Bacillus cereus group]ALQ70825.1 TetR family transcriptional regulator [Bacillus thuringiensis]OUA12843.1 TetR family transcriptional regulator [Bacillus thuringiensis serovar finitimus]PEC84452.1 TetR/AcrR family transcriptional regulator [Bacillus cereus]PEQ53843.1 TetR/AcrR family transcriptional regulator [Bacillus cereus]PEX35784.1 TetR/AcrR family transcriptional regulator [Bacillus cereus]
MVKHNVHASVKDEKLVALRREQMIKGAVQLFKQKGFPRTTTREIAKAAGFSIGTLYEYIRTKDDVLYLVCDSIYEHVKERLEEVVCTEKGSIESLKVAITNYFKVMDELQEEVLIMYQEVRFLPKESLPYVLEKEFQMVGMFEDILEQCTANGTFTLNKKEIQLLAHNIFIQGQMWGFRRWALQKLYTLEEYTEMQIRYVLQGAHMLPK